MVSEEEDLTFADKDLENVDTKRKEISGSSTSGISPELIRAKSASGFSDFWRYCGMTTVKTGV